MFYFNVFLYLFFVMYTFIGFTEGFICFLYLLLNRFSHCSFNVCYLQACPCMLYLLPAVVTNGLQCGTFVYRNPIRCIAKSTWSGSGNFCFWFSTEFCHSLYWFLFDNLFSFCCDQSFGYCVLFVPFISVLFYQFNRSSVQGFFFHHFVP